MSDLAKVRIDKWLWATRWFKTRSLATEACHAGKVRVDGNTVKPAYMLQPGHMVQLTRGGIKHVIKVEKLLEKRAGAPMAAQCFTDLTPPEEREKFNPSFFHHFEIRDKGAGRPTKKERREIDRFKEED